MQRKIRWVFVIIVCLGFQTVLPIHAGEDTITSNRPEAEIQIRVTYDDIFYKGSKDGEIAVRIEIVELHCMKVGITVINTWLERIGGVALFDSPNWTPGVEFFFDSRGAKEWVFMPQLTIGFDSGVVSLWVEIVGRFYTSQTAYNDWNVHTEKDVIKVKIEEKQGIPGFEWIMTLMALPVIIWKKKREK